MKKTNSGKNLSKTLKNLQDKYGKNRDGFGIKLTQEIKTILMLDSKFRINLMEGQGSITLFNKIPVIHFYLDNGFERMITIETNCTNETMDKLNDIISKIN